MSENNREHPLQQFTMESFIHNIIFCKKKLQSRLFSASHRISHHAAGSIPITAIKSCGATVTAV